MINLVIFDYDGLLVDSETLAFEAECKLLQKYGHTLTWDYFQSFLGISVRDTLREYIQYFGISTTLDDLYKKRESYISHLIDTQLRLMPGAPELLQFLKHENIPRIIASSGSRNYVIHGLKTLKIDTFFSHIFCAEDVKRTKPYPDLFLKASEKMNVPSSEVLVLEDAPSGIEAALQAKMMCIAVSPNYVSPPISRGSYFITSTLYNVITLLQTVR